MPSPLLAWLTSAGLVEFVLCLIVVEALALLAYRALRGGGIAAADLWANLAAGAFLLFAVRAALRGERRAVPAWLVLAFGAHLWDLRRRWRG